MQTPLTTIEADENVISKHPHLAVNEAWRAIEGARISVLLSNVFACLTHD
jgi:hypothetical protein